MDNATKGLILTMVIAAVLGFGYANLAEAAYTPDSGALASWECTKTGNVTIQGTAWAFSRNGAFIDGCVLTNSASPAQNDEMGWIFFSGTATPRTFYIRYGGGGDGGIMTVLVNDVSAGTIDAYDAGATPNNLTASMAITPAVGQNSIRIAMRTKNGASSNYIGRFQDWYIK